LRQFIGSGDGKRQYGLPGQIFATRHAKAVLLWSVRRIVAIPSVLVLPVPGQVNVDALNIRLMADIIEKPWNIDAMSPQWALLDLDRTVCPLYVRFRQPSDRFYPLGAPGSKKLQDFFVDSKIPRVERPYVPLVVSQDQIVWVVGYRIADPFRLRPETNRVLRLQYCALQEANR
jgi:tRNA(Ile)-lysidine synthase